MQVDRREETDGEDPPIGEVKLAAVGEDAAKTAGSVEQRDRA